MRLFGQVSELTQVVFREDGFEISLDANTATTYTANRIVLLPEGDTAHVLVSRTSTDTLTNKTLTSPVINTPTGITKTDVGLGNVDNTSDATKNAAAVTLTNKTLTAPIIDQGIFTEGAAPSTPAANKVAVYAKADGRMYSKDDAGVESALTAATVATPTATGTVTSYFSTIQSAIKTVSSADYTVLTLDGYQTVLVTTGSSTRAITLPAASANTGRTLTIKKVDSGTGKVTVNRAGSDTIDGNSIAYVSKQWDFLQVTSDGTNWFLVTDKFTPVSFTQIVSVANTETIPTTSSTTLQDTGVAAFGTAQLDNYSATNSTVFTVPVGMQGLYRFQMSCQWRLTSLGSSGSICGFVAQVNGSGNTNDIVPRMILGATSINNTTITAGEIVLNLNVGDTVGLRAIYASIGGGTTTFNYQNMRWNGTQLSRAV